jgi:deoxynucleoside triphosphate triphosphohydrolase SAMHD1
MGSRTNPKRPSWGQRLVLIVSRRLPRSVRKTFGVDRTQSTAPPSLTSHRDQLEHFAEALLRPYIHSLQRRRPVGRTKEFNDPVWETIVLRPLEVLILDSPLLQRLRRIRQLGVAHWVYPGSVHTRLEHSLGAVHLIDRLTKAINDRPRSHEGVPQQYVNLLRLSALLHDVGHGFMSHVSENALAYFEEAMDLKAEFCDEHQIEKVQLSEIAAFYLVGSPAFRELLQLIQELTNDHDLPPHAIDLIQKTIISRPVWDAWPLLQELISGPFDVDKLDYITRDATMSGVPVVTDIPRLVQKVRAIALSSDELPSDIASKVKGGESSYILTGIALSGGRTLDELMIGRSLLYDKIYRHQKVRAAEVMIASVFEQIADILPGGPLMFPYHLVDDQVLDLTQQTIASRLSRSLTTLETARCDIARDLTRRLNDRQLLVRAYAFAQNMPHDPHRSDSRQRLGISSLLGLEADHRRELARTVASEVMRIIGILGPSDLADEWRDRLAAFIWIDPPASHSPGDTARAFLISERGKPIKFKEDSAETKGWADAYLSTRDIGYVFCPAEVASYVFIALERIARDEFSIRTPDSIYEYVKLDQSVVDTQKEQLATKGYYSTSHRDLLPLPERLRRADIPKRLSEIVERLALYQGIAGSEEKVTVNSARVIEWLKQFDGDLIDSALELLGSVRVIGRRDCVEALEKFLAEYPEFSGANICQFGTPKDSSAIVTYYAEDLASRFPLKVQDLHVSLDTKAARPIIFVDDFIMSGNQASGIIETWMGHDPTVDLREERMDALSDERREGLRERKIGFVFAAGSQSGLDQLLTRCKELGLNAVGFVLIESEAVPKAFSDGSQGRTAKLKDRCREVGLQLLLDSSSGHDETWARDRALGYGNQAFLVLSSYNVPTQALTCLWAEGLVDGAPWTPLIPRRKKT